MLSLDDFKPVTLDDADFFRQYYSRYPQVHSDNTFTNMTCWNHYANYSYAKVDDNVILASTIDGVTKFRPPIGPYNPDLTRDLVSLAAETGEEEPIILIDPASASLISYVYPDMEMSLDRDQSEYVYRATDLAELQGRDYLYIRRDLNKFRRNHSHRVEPITAANAAHVKDFLDQWFAARNPEDSGMISHEKKAIMYGLDHMAELGLSGLAIKVDGRIGAISMYERLNGDTALVHFEKGLQDYPGIYKAINAETAALLGKEFTYINRESDMGVPGLREAKMRYHPHHMVEVYSVVRPKDHCMLQYTEKCKCCSGCCG
ncbi:DUF2156 domain-containing protein [Methanocella arvoryzae]|uniref:Phosphatidylglycerol lysyltransferase C-terminal domain-containing protein n=1 Tax=Methanocella arvoryzae (strain DSM 22066 / NBRC 105507 / MRE50) TaxID=351160 RepID=Q0W0Y2_METAR|nr:phosphatidylglycerol lysyltransferase domain-containing protein [Methanocella arvoryzae]CAJ37961.1 conserved hypothetical protein [Methanocella arvoryzae MRE50]